MTIRAASAGKYQVQLSYLALGMDWSADYTARIHPDGRTMDVSAWITLLNLNGSRLANAKTNVVAGTLARDAEETQPQDIDVPNGSVLAHRRLSPDRYRLAACSEQRSARAMAARINGPR